MDTFHKPVLKDEVAEALNVKKGKLYIDATIGGGGHTEEILKRGGIVLGIDLDPEAIKYVEKNLESRIQNSELKLVRGNFQDIAKIAWENGFEKVDGALFDLGLSSYQIEQSGRGFSFLRDEPLDMRISSESHLTAREIINKWTEAQLYDLFSRMGEDPNSHALAESIVRARRLKPIKTTGELVQIINNTVRGREKRHPATRMFQALRIGVNQELENLKKGLSGAFNLLAGGGRLAVISFHSLEDRIVKRYFTELKNRGLAKLITKKPIIASLQEIRENKRARSAKLRVIARLG